MTDVTWEGRRAGEEHDLVADESTECPPEPMDSEDLLLLMYTSGTTAKPKGIAHTTAGYLVGAATTHRARHTSWTPGTSPASGCGSRRCARDCRSGSPLA